MTIHIYDGGNQVRLRLHNDIGGLALRNLYMDVQQHRPDAVFFCWDGFNCNKRRRDRYPAYKTQRKPPAEDVFASVNLFKELAKLSHAVSIEVPGYEADDVIATLVRGAKGDKVVIHSNDGDYLQLTGPNVTLTRDPYKHCTSDMVRLYKASVGDPSDKIIGIKGFGEKSWESTNKSQLQKLLQGDDVPLESLNVLPGIVNWLKIPENLDEARRAYEIVGFYDVPGDLISKHLTVGTPNFPAVDKILSELML